MKMALEGAPPGGIFSTSPDRELFRVCGAECVRSTGAAGRYAGAPGGVEKSPLVCPFIMASDEAQIKQANAEFRMVQSFWVESTHLRHIDPERENQEMRQKSGRM